MTWHTFFLVHLFFYENQTSSWKIDHNQCTKFEQNIFTFCEWIHKLSQPREFLLFSSNSYKFLWNLARRVLCLSLKFLREFFRSTINKKTLIQKLNQLRSCGWSRETFEMKMFRDFAKFLLCSLALSSVFAGREELKEPENNEKVLHRQKRFLIFPGGGTAKFVCKWKMKNQMLA